MDTGIEINTPFYHVSKTSNEVNIKSKYFVYSEIGCKHYGLQVNNESKRDEILKLCKEISTKTKELLKLTEE